MSRRLVSRKGRLVLATLMLASFLGICGCNLERTCDPQLADRFSALLFSALRDECSRYLPSPRLASLPQAHEDAAASSAESAILRDPGAEETLAAETLSTSDVPGARVRQAGTDNQGSGSESRWVQQARPVPWPIPESALFLYSAPESLADVGFSDHAAPRRIAAGFILSVPARRGQVARYLVTARHVVDPEWARCGEKNPQKIMARLNRWDGGVGYELLTLEAHHDRLFLTLADDVTDLALLPLTAESVPRLSEYKLGETSFDMLPSGAELDPLHGEQRIVTIGVSLPKLAGLSDSPISSSGIIVAGDSSGRKMSVRCTARSPVKPLRMWLMDTSVERGVSGAPVYAASYQGPERLTPPVLVGVQAVVWPDKGQAGITPVSALRDLVQLQRSRDELAMDIRGHHAE